MGAPCQCRSNETSRAPIRAVLEEQLFFWSQLEDKKNIFFRDGIRRPRMTLIAAPVKTWEKLLHTIPHLLTYGLTGWLFWGQSYSTCDHESFFRDPPRKLNCGLRLDRKNPCRTLKACTRSSSIHIKKVRGNRISTFREIVQNVPKSTKSAPATPQTVSTIMEPFRSRFSCSDPLNTRNVSPNTLFRSFIRVFPRKKRRGALHPPGCAQVPQVEKSGK